MRKGMETAVWRSRLNWGSKEVAKSAPQTKIILDFKQILRLDALSPCRHLSSLYKFGICKNSYLLAIHEKWISGCVCVEMEPCCVMLVSWIVPRVAIYIRALSEQGHPLHCSSCYLEMRSVTLSEAESFSSSEVSQSCKELLFRQLGFRHGFLYLISTLANTSYHLPPVLGQKSFARPNYKPWANVSHSTYWVYLGSHFL